MFLFTNKIICLTTEQVLLMIIMLLRVCNISISQNLGILHVFQLPNLLDIEAPKDLQLAYNK